jgi:carboxylesterase
VKPCIDAPAESFRAVLRGALESGTDIAPGVGSDIKKDGVAELAYPGTPIAAALSLFEGIEETAAGLAAVTCPVLLLSSRVDHVVPSSSGDVLEAGVTGPVERVWLEDSYHVATLDNEADDVTARIVAFIGRVLR